jgi:hypothetical protein
VISGFTAIYASVLRVAGQIRAGASGGCGLKELEYLRRSLAAGAHERRYAEHATHLKLTNILNQVKNCFYFSHFLLLSSAVSNPTFVDYFFHTLD